MRVEEAMLLRAEAEASMRLWLYIDRQPNDVVAPMTRDQMDRILSMVAAEVPPAHAHVVKRTMGEMLVCVPMSVMAPKRHPW